MQWQSGKGVGRIGRKATGLNPQQFFQHYFFVHNFYLLVTMLLEYFDYACFICLVSAFISLANAVSVFKSQINITYQFLSCFVSSLLCRCKIAHNFAPLLPICTQFGRYCYNRLFTPSKFERNPIVLVQVMAFFVRSTKRK